MKFKIGDIVKSNKGKVGIIIDLEIRGYNEYALACGSKDLVMWHSEHELKKLSGGIKGNKVIGSFVKNILHNKCM